MFNKKIKKLATLFMCAMMTFSTVSVANADYDGEAAAEYALKYAKDEKIVQIAEVGDIIQCKKGNNDLSHSVIVTEKMIMI